MGSILRGTDGVGKIETPREGVVVVTFDDGKTDVVKIVKSLEKGGFNVKGKPLYVKPDTAAPPGTDPGMSTQTPRNLPLYPPSPAAAGVLPH